MLQESIGLSVIFGFLASEFIGISAGGLVSPGYLAFFMDQPLRLLATIVLALVIYFAVRLMQKFMIVYGSRRFMTAVLLSLLGAWIAERLLFRADAISVDIRVIGYIIPGLIANDMLRQGVVRTIALIGLVALLIRVIMMTGIFG